MILLEIALALVFIWLVLRAVRSARRFDGDYGTMLVFGISCFAYNVAIPLEVALSGTDRARVGRFTLLMDAETRLAIWAASLLALAGFAGEITGDCDCCRDAWPGARTVYRIVSLTPAPVV